VKPLLLMLILSLASPAIAKDRAWQDATVANISSDTSGTVVAPIGGMIVGVPIRRTYYWIKTEKITYVLFLSGGKRPLDVTLHGATKIAIDGRNGHILDDGGKDVKLPIVEKIAN